MVYVAIKSWRALLPKGSFLDPTSAITTLLCTSIPDGSSGWFGF